MPKLIVYVKADTWRRVVDSAGADAPALARALSVEAIEEFVAGLTEGEPREAKAVASELSLTAKSSPSPSVSPEPKKRLHPCKHHVPPSRVCDYCDR